MLKKQNKLLCAAFTTIAIFSSTATYATDQSAVGRPAVDQPIADQPALQQDPYESFNRAMFSFNDFLDKYLLKPIGQLYNAIVPHPLAKGFTNVFNNIDTIPTVINDVLQGNFYQATSDVWRLGVNTTVGIGGLFDVAQRMGLEPNSEDFGLTLARWGYTDSNYLVLPFLGPGTIRDAIGFPINYYGMTIYPYISSTSIQYGLYGFGIIVRRADLLSYEGVLNQLSFDKYVFTRDAYLQHRNYMIQRNKELGDPYLSSNKLEEGGTSSTTEVKAAAETKPFVDS